MRDHYEVLGLTRDASDAEIKRAFRNEVIGFVFQTFNLLPRATALHNVELPLIISDHADWDELTQTIRELAPREVWITHGREDALKHWCMTHQIKARELNLVGYEDEFYFSRAFKTVTGVAPSFYRKQFALELSPAADAGSGSDVADGGNRCRG